MVILLTGGTGYIASHTAVACIERGHEVILFDNLSNSNSNVVNSLEQILHQKITFIQGDVLNTDFLREVLTKYHVDSVIHFAGLKSVKDGAELPIPYYDNNVAGTISLLKAMNSAHVKQLVFSSSATVYGYPEYLPYDEKHPTQPINVYGRTKLQVENILQDLSISDPDWKILSLRYFNPVGAHESGLIGERPNGIPNNLMPFVAKVANGELPVLNVYGNDYDTKDGTGERDYIHVMDLADGHVAALNYLAQSKAFQCINLGTGIPYSVYELVNAFEKACGKKIPMKISPRRLGDLPFYYADPSLAKQLLRWKAKRSLIDMCETTWKFQKTK